MWHGNGNLDKAIDLLDIQDKEKFEMEGCCARPRMVVTSDCRKAHLPDHCHHKRWQTDTLYTLPGLRQRPDSLATASFLSYRQSATDAPQEQPGEPPSHCC